MIHPTDVYTLKAKVHKLKHKLYAEPSSIHEKQLAERYLNEVLFLLEELKP
jgi:hypothetical protein